jgi:hypothetical protein
MLILQLLAEKEPSIHKKWLELVFSEFQPEAVRFLRGKDPFANPLGHSFSEGLREIFRILRSEEPSGGEEVLEHLMKLRAVQKELTPSASLAFIFALKGIIRQECRQEWSAELDREWPELTDRIDRLALAGFDFYMASRERLYQVRIRELKSGRHLLTDQAKCPSAVLREEMKSKKQGESDGNLNHSNQDAR